jgi:hypothetical protein
VRFSPNAGHSDRSCIRLGAGYRRVLIHCGVGSAVFACVGGELVAKDAALPAAGVFAKLAAGLVGLVVPAAVGAGLWTRVKSHPLDTVLLLVGYWLAMGLVALATGVGRELKAAWVPRLADAVDTAVMAAVYQRRKHYLRQLGDSVRDVETPGLMTQASHILRLQQVYVEVSLGAQPLQDTAAEPFVGRLPSPVEGRTLDTILAGDAHRVYAVIGGPGSGKTTLLRHTALELCERRRRGPLPVLLYLRDHLAGILADSGPGAVGLAGIATEAGWLRGKIPGQWLDGRLDRGGCVVMLDGLDEVADEADRRSVVTWVNRQIERYPRNSFVITSRPAGYQSNPLGKADVLQVRRLSVEQISVFLHGWYYAINRRAMDETGERVRVRSTREADDLLERLRRQPALYDLAANPLLLTMIATVHRYRGALPGSRAALYGEMCQVLLHRRQEAKGLTDLETSLRGEQKEYVVQVLALYMMRNQIRDLPAKRICQVVRSSLAQTSSKVTPEQFLAEIHRSGLLVERENGVYSFAHLTLQEYLAAAQIRQSQRVDLLADRVDDPWWRETTLLWTAGDDATPVVKACLRKGTIRALALAFDCADEARGINTEVRRELDDLTVTGSGCTAGMTCPIRMHCASARGWKPSHQCTNNQPRGPRSSWQSRCRWRSPQPGSCQPTPRMRRPQGLPPASPIGSPLLSCGSLHMVVTFRASMTSTWTCA